MSQLIVGLHAGYHDSSPVVFEDYTFKAAVQLERLTRIKEMPRNFPIVASKKCSPLSANGALRATRGVRQIQVASPAEEAARRIAAGEIGAIYTGRMEYGPRALGARSILASPQNRETHEKDQ